MCAAEFKKRTIGWEYWKHLGIGLGWWHADLSSEIATLQQTNLKEGHRIFKGRCFSLFAPPYCYLILLANCCEWHHIVLDTKI
jgi:hypothetical protein